MSSEATPEIPTRGIVGDFLSALRDPFSYQPWRNLYALFGLLWALPIPVLVFYLLCAAPGVPPGLAGIMEVCTTTTLAPLSVLHVPLFMVVFGVFGTLRRNQDARIASLVATQKERLKELRESHRHLIELDRLKDEFVANVTHELKTPLVSACAYGEMMLGERLGEINDRQRHGLEVAVRNLRRLEVLIDDMLLFAQMEAGSFEAYPAPFSIDELVAEMGSNFLAACTARGVSLHLPEDPVGARVFADQEGVRSVLVNLLSNALKFSHNGGSIRLGVEALPDGVQVEVEDQGYGIPAEALPRIFDRFHQVEGTRGRRFGGAGLGLAIVKRVLDAHQVEITVVSVEGEGTRFRFLLPLAPEGGGA